MPKRLPHVLALTAIFLASPLPRATATDQPLGLSAAKTPLLWAGRVIDRHGAPSAAHLTAFLRPPASAIPEAGSGLRAPASIPLISAVAGPDGRFELRGDLPVAPPEFRPDGWLHVMVLAEASDGSWSVANDSMRYVSPLGGLPRGAWISTLAREDVLRSALAARKLPTTAALDRMIGEDLSGGSERPEVLQLGEPKFMAAGARRASGHWVGPGDPFVGCSALAVEGREEAFRTISDIDVGPAWTYVLDYTKTGTTSWEIGVEQSGGQWKAGGTTSFSNSSSRGFNAEYGPYPSRFREAYQVQLVHAKVLWRCASSTSPGPFYIRTVEPESWTGGTFNQGDPVVPCNPENRKPVGGRTTGWRKEGKTSTYSASGGAYGFHGSAAVTYSNEIRLGWKNTLEHPRDVCGESGNPFDGRTRVAAMDEHL